MPYLQQYGASDGLCPRKDGGMSSNPGTSSSSFSALATASSSLLADRKKGVTFATTTSSTPRPPWEGDEQPMFEAPPGYLVLAGDEPEQDKAQHVFMNVANEDRLFQADPWAYYRPQPPPPAPTIPQCVLGAITAVDNVTQSVGQAVSTAIIGTAAAAASTAATIIRPLRRSRSEGTLPISVPGGMFGLQPLPATYAAYRSPQSGHEGPMEWLRPPPGPLPDPRMPVSGPTQQYICLLYTSDAADDW